MRIAGEGGMEALSFRWLDRPPDDHALRMDLQLAEAAIRELDVSKNSFDFAWIDAIRGSNAVRIGMSRYWCLFGWTDDRNMPSDYSPQVRCAGSAQFFIAVSFKMHWNSVNEPCCPSVPP